jgi:molybdate transport system ATP-binding protein
VALARALAVEPRLLLLDEPLAALDVGTRPAVRADLRRHLAAYEGCTIVVTHDPLEALVLGDRLVVLEHGRIVQDGPPEQITRHPRTDYVARLVGLNLLRGTADGRIATVGPGALVTLAHDAAGPVHVAFSPAAVTLSLHRPEGSARNAWEGTVADLERHGDLVRITVDGPVPVLADVTPLAVADLDLAPGVTVWASVKATEVTVYPA